MGCLLEKPREGASCTEGSSPPRWWGMPRCRRPPASLEGSTLEAGRALMPEEVLGQKLVGHNETVKPRQSQCKSVNSQLTAVSLWLVVNCSGGVGEDESNSEGRIVGRGTKAEWRAGKEPAGEAEGEVGAPTAAGSACSEREGAWGA